MTIRPTRIPVAAVAVAVVVVALTGCTAGAGPKPTSTKTAAVETGADLPIAAFGGASGDLLTHLGNGKSLQWLQVTDRDTAYSTVSTGTALAALVTDPPSSWTVPKGGKPVKVVGAVYRSVDAFYSRSIASIDDLTTGATVVLPKDATAVAAALHLLASKDLITLGGDGSRVADVTANPKGLVLVKRTPDKIPAALKTAALVYVQADAPAVAALTSKDTAVLVEPKADQEVVSLVARTSTASSSKVQALYRQLTSQATAAWLTRTLPNATHPLG